MCLLWRSPLPVTSHASDAAAAPWGGDPVLFPFMPSVGVKYRFAEYGSQPEAGTGGCHEASTVSEVLPREAKLKGKRPLTMR